METYYYTQELNLLPFMLIRVEHGQREMTPELWPRKLDKYQEDLWGFLYAESATKVGFARPVVTHLGKFKEWVVLSITIRVRADKLGEFRKGLKLTYGALVSPELFLKTPNLAEDFFISFHDYIKRRYNVPATVDEVENVVLRYQTDHSFSNERDLSADDNFLASIEARYGLNLEERRLSIRGIRDLRVARKLSRLDRLQSFDEIADTLPYWREVSAEFSQGKTVTSDRGDSDDQQVTEEISRLNFNTLYSGFQSTVSTIMTFPYPVAILLLTHFGTQSLLSDAAIIASAPLIVKFKAMLALIGLVVLLHFFERHLYLWSVWNSLQTQAIDKISDRRRFVNMSQGRFISIVVSSLLTLIGTSSLVYFCVSDALQFWP